MSKKREVNLIVIHCTATSPKAKMQSILDGWRKKGWTSNGYHKLIAPNGLSARLMDDELIGNGVRGHNSKAIHISYIGGINEKGMPTDTRTIEQKEMIRFEVEEYKKKYPKAVVLGHRDLSPDLDKDGIVEPHEWIKVCPCFEVSSEFRYLNK